MEILDKHIDNNFYDIQAKKLKKKLEQDKLTKPQSSKPTENQEFVYNLFGKDGVLAGLIESDSPTSLELEYISKLFILGLQVDSLGKTTYAKAQSMNKEDFSSYLSDHYNLNIIKIGNKIRKVSKQFELNKEINSNTFLKN